MPYSPAKPPSKTKTLTTKGRRQWVHVFNSVVEGGASEESAHRQAWAAVRRSGNRKKEAGWFSKSVKSETPMPHVEKLLQQWKKRVAKREVSHDLPPASELALAAVKDDLERASAPEGVEELRRLVTNKVGPDTRISGPLPYVISVLDDLNATTGHNYDLSKMPSQLFDAYTPRDIAKFVSQQRNLATLPWLAPEPKVQPSKKKQPSFIQSLERIPMTDLSSKKTAALLTCKVKIAAALFKKKTKTQTTKVEGGASEESAHRQAWAAVRRSGNRKKEAGWFSKSPPAPQPTRALEKVFESWARRNDQRSKGDTSPIVYPTAMQLSMAAIQDALERHLHPEDLPRFQRDFTKNITPATTISGAETLPIEAVTDLEEVLGLRYDVDKLYSLMSKSRKSITPQQLANFISDKRNLGFPMDWPDTTKPKGKLVTPNRLPKAKSKTEKVAVRRISENRHIALLQKRAAIAKFALHVAVAQQRGGSVKKAEPIIFDSVVPSRPPTTQLSTTQPTTQPDTSSSPTASGSTFADMLNNYASTIKNWQYTPHALAGAGLLGTAYQALNPTDAEGNERSWMRYLPWLALMAGGGYLQHRNMNSVKQ